MSTVVTRARIRRVALAGAPRRRAGRVGAVVAGVLVLAMAGVAPAPAASNPTVAALTTQTATLAPGQSAWVSVVWTADQTVTDWSTTVSAPGGVTVSYPTTRGGADTSLYGSATLVGRTRDFTAFRVSVPYTQTTGFQVTVKSTYLAGGQSGNNGEGNNGEGNNGNNGQNNQASKSSASRLVTEAKISVPVQAATGPAVTLKTKLIAIKSGTNDFHQIAFTAGQTDLGNVSMTLGALPAGLVIAYPGDRQSAGLNGGTTLVGGTTDYASVRLNATDLKPGVYTIPVTLSYTAAAAGTLTDKVILFVS